MKTITDKRGAWKGEIKIMTDENWWEGENGINEDNWEKINKERHRYNDRKSLSS